MGPAVAVAPPAPASAPSPKFYAASAQALSTAGAADLARIDAMLGDALIGVHVHANHAKRSQFEPVEGHALVMAPTAPLRPQAINSNMNGQIVVARIFGRLGDSAAAAAAAAAEGASEPAPLTLADFKGAAAALATLAEEHSGFAHGGVVDAATGADALPWEPVLGAGSLVGVYRTSVRDVGDFDGHGQGGGDGREEPLFFVAAVVSETPVGKDAHAYLEQCAAAGMSAGAYARDETARRLRRLAVRNARRLLARAAVALGVTIEWERDLYAVAGAGAAGAATATKPLSALPQVHAEFNVFSQPLLTAADDAPVVFYDHCQDAFAAHGGVVLQLDARQGLLVAQAQRALRGQFLNAAANSYPLRLPQGANAAAERVGSARIAWPGKATGAASPEAAVVPLTAADRATLAKLAPNAEQLGLVPVAVRLTRARDF